MDHLGNAQVEKVFELSRNVGDEVHRWLQFLRFGEIENGIMFARFEPKNRVLVSGGELNEELAVWQEFSNADILEKENLGRVFYHVKELYEYFRYRY